MYLLNMYLTKTNNCTLIVLKYKKFHVKKLYAPSINWNNVGFNKKVSMRTNYYIQASRKV